MVGWRTSSIRREKELVKVRLIIFCVLMIFILRVSIIYWTIIGCGNIQLCPWKENSWESKYVYQWVLFHLIIYSFGIMWAQTIAKMMQTFESNLLPKAKLVLLACKSCMLMALVVAYLCPYEFAYIHRLF